MKTMLGILAVVAALAFAANFALDYFSGAVTKGYFDERVAVIECKLDTLTARLGIVERKLDTLTAKVERVSANTDSIKSTVNENGWKLDVIKADIEEIKGKAVEFRLF